MKTSFYALCVLCYGLWGDGVQATSENASPSASPPSASAPAPPPPFPTHGFSTYGKLKYLETFTHFDYANPNAPNTSKQKPRKWRKILAELKTLDAMSTSTAPAPYPTYGELNEEGN